MACFDRGADLNSDRAFRLVHNSFVTMFWSNLVLAENLDWLTRNAYQVVELDSAGCADLKSLLSALAAALEFPDYFGGNLNAFDDCMRDVVAGDYGANLAATGFVLVLRHYDNFVRRNADAAHAVVDIFAEHCRDAALFGHRMMCLVQSDDPDLDLPPVGATPVVWNDAEWLNSRRGPLSN